LIDDVGVIVVEHADRIPTENRLAISAEGDGIGAGRFLQSILPAARYQAWISTAARRGASRPGAGGAGCRRSQVLENMLTKVDAGYVIATNYGSNYVLVVDDDPAVQHMVSDYFEQHGTPIVAASDRAGVARHLAGEHPSAIILNLCLAQGDGLDLLRAIRSCSDVPLIVVTAHSRDEVDCVVSLELGADDCITKPFSVR
jgi:CheY-like chemotaxis protein